ncbi:MULTISPECIES: hypothetical protein [Chryseobacterium]|uniref:Uncharacterized protein n=1 Tax=Chryseobacterium geocarposphaerae TaxID=1416776 RepID=A0ABU1LAY5_9FLAO|nr:MULTISPECIES: hypothetical protein [Chryseobacterium]MDR6403888.1 hypothetical protein [Chryseobacterium geocarposphaerae]MDR6698593.1 hypothetical protein [Chryseobacterium ginsenosidimutans]
MESPISNTPFNKIIIVDKEGNKQEIIGHKIIIEDGKTEYELDPSPEGFNIICLKPDENNEYYSLAIRPFAANGIHLLADRYTEN